MSDYSSGLWKKWKCRECGAVLRDRVRHVVKTGHEEFDKIGRWKNEYF